MDSVGAYNRNRWKQLVEANALFTRPQLDLTPETAKSYLDPQNILGDVGDKEVLCLASGGGQQSVAFALLGANVVVCDLSPEQLERDREAARSLRLSMQVVEADMRDLSLFANGSFDVVWQPFSLNFVPLCLPVFREVSRVLRPGGLYHVMVTNPFAFGMTHQTWNGSGYPISRPYISGEQASYEDQEFAYDRSEAGEEIPRPIEYRHTLADLVNGLSASGFCIRGVHEEQPNNQSPTPGDWEHFKLYLPPWLTFWATKHQENLGL